MTVRHRTGCLDLCRGEIHRRALPGNAVLEEQKQEIAALNYTSAQVGFQISDFLSIMLGDICMRQKRNTT